MGEKNDTKQTRRRMYNYGAKDKCHEGEKGL